MQNEMEREERSALEERRTSCEKEKSDRETNMDLIVFKVKRVHVQKRKSHSQNEGINENNITIN